MSRERLLRRFARMIAVATRFQSVIINTGQKFKSFQSMPPSARESSICIKYFPIFHFTAMSCSATVPKIISRFFSHGLFCAFVFARASFLTLWKVNPPAPLRLTFFSGGGPTPPSFLSAPASRLRLTFLPSGVVLDIREGQLSWTFRGGGRGPQTDIFFWRGGGVQNTNQPKP